MNSYLEIKNITKEFLTKKQKKTVLKNINFKVEKGEILTILGPSGCGKSTLLKIIAGFIKAENGKIIKAGTEICQAGLDRLMLFQDFEQLFPWLKVIDNVVFALKAAKKTQKNKLVDQNFQAQALKYLKEVKLENYSNYYPHQLSGGMKQRVALARTLAARGDIMLMDEPFASVDSQTRKALQQLLIDIWQEEERTIIFVTHDLQEAVYLSDRIILMKNEPGEITAVLKNRLSRPRNRNSQQFGDFSKKLEKKLKN